jgi:hypothetical protein
MYPKLVRKSLSTKLEVVCAERKAKNFNVRRVKNTDRIVLVIKAKAASKASKATCD